jgi:hypothetical protein
MTTTRLIRAYELMYLLLLLALFSCKLSRETARSTSASVSGTAADSAKIIRSASVAADSGRWWRETVRYLPGRDTTTILKPQYFYSTQPVEVVREGGNYSRSTQDTRTDSAGQHSRDTTAVISSAKTTDTKARGLSFWDALGISLVVGAVFFLLTKLKFSFK